ncbi:hypothetical protein BJ912DRAFT_950137 [Pholiota molesta]|nr:hypothetical protein BJ912DRAFT_950137 [Pholiota molesta]
MFTISRFCPWVFPKSSPLDRSSVASGSRNASNGSIYEGALKLSKAEIEQQRSLAAKIRAVRRRSTQKSKENIDSNEKKIYNHASSSQSTRPHNKRPYTESLASTDDEAAGTPKGFAEVEDIVMLMFPDEESMPSERVRRDPLVEDSNTAVGNWLQNLPNGSSYEARPILARRPPRPHARPHAPRPHPSEDVIMLDPEVVRVPLGTPTASLPKALTGRRLPLLSESNLKRSALSVHIQTSPRKRRKLEARPAIVAFEWYEHPHVRIICEEHQRSKMVNKHAAIVPSLSNPLRGATHPVVWSGAVEKSMAELALDKRLRRHRPRHYLSLICPQPQDGKGKGDRIVSAYQKIIHVASTP